MSGLLSVRITREERIRLQRYKNEHGHHNLSQAVRAMLGLDPKGAADPLEGGDDIENVDKLARYVVRAVDRIDDMHELLLMVARKVGVDAVSPGNGKVGGHRRGTATGDTRGAAVIAQLEQPRLTADEPFPLEPDGKNRVALPDETWQR